MCVLRKELASAANANAEILNILENTANVTILNVQKAMESTATDKAHAIVESVSVKRDGAAKPVIAHLMKLRVRTTLRYVSQPNKIMLGKRSSFLRQSFLLSTLVLAAHLHKLCANMPKHAFVAKHNAC